MNDGTENPTPQPSSRVPIDPFAQLVEETDAKMMKEIQGSQAPQANNAPPETDESQVVSYERMDQLEKDVAGLKELLAKHGIRH